MARDPAVMAGYIAEVYFIVNAFNLLNYCILVRVYMHISDFDYVKFQISREVKR